MCMINFTFKMSSLFYKSPLESCTDLNFLREKDRILKLARFPVHPFRISMSLNGFERVAQGHRSKECRYEPASDYLSDTDRTRFFAGKLTGLE